MNIKEINLADIQIASHTSKRNRESRRRLARVCAVVTRPSLRGLAGKCRRGQGECLLDSPSPQIKSSVPKDPMLTGIIIKLRFYIAALCATVYLASTPTKAVGAPAGHMSAGLSHGNEHYRYSALLWGFIVFRLRRHLRLELFVHTHSGTAGHRETTS